ncbi:hypothetical protein ACKTEK_09515 [Tepidamorphus sp. 3E244]|uniref:hypothetical protein n=1 Tax=Tepidamorphus sp. 3E244 TaxID=3385498 RepID=UPI0038FD3E89
MMHARRATAVLLASVLTSSLAWSAGAQARDWQSPDSPFVLGEAYPDVPATCETAEDWIDLAPPVDGRVSFAITGKLVVIEQDTALAYLVMCEETQVQVMCVTYSTKGRHLGEKVLFAGGWSRGGERQITLDRAWQRRPTDGSN